jgi:hypothetical protein
MRIILPLITFEALEGQCHEMVVEMIPWSSSLDLDK